MVLPDSRQQLREADLGRHDDSPGEGAGQAETVLGWPLALRLAHDPEGIDNSGPQAGIESLLTLALPVLGAVALTVRFRVATGMEQVSWPAASAPVDSASEGPMAECEDQAKKVEAGDLSTDPRWPAFSAAAVVAGLHSVIVVPLLDESGCCGSVGCFYGETREFAARVATAKLEVLAAHVTVLVANAETFAVRGRTITQLREAMVSRSVIEQAKGALMAREKIDAETAWAYLVKVSQRTHRKLRDISEDVIAKASSGAL